MSNGDIRSQPRSYLRASSFLELNLLSLKQKTKNKKKKSFENFQKIPGTLRHRDTFLWSGLRTSGDARYRDGVAFFFSFLNHEFYEKFSFFLSLSSTSQKKGGKDCGIPVIHYYIHPCMFLHDGQRIQNAFGVPCEKYGKGETPRERENLEKMEKIYGLYKTIFITGVKDGKDKGIRMCPYCGLFSPPLSNANKGGEMRRYLFFHITILPCSMSAGRNSPISCFRTNYIINRSGSLSVRTKGKKNERPFRSIGKLTKKERGGFSHDCI